MKGLNFIIAGVFIAVLVFFLLMLGQMRHTVQLQSERVEKQKVILEASTARKKLAKLEKDLNDLKTTADFVKKMVLPDDASVLGVIKEMSKIVSRYGAKNVQFSYKPKFNLPSGVPANNDLAKNYGLKKSRAAFIAADFESEYTALEEFLKDIYALKTAISVERVSIARNENIIPRQKVSLVLAVYIY